MKREPIRHLFRAAIAGVSLCAWLAVSNHCAIAGLLPAPTTAESGHEHCPGHEAPAEKKQDSGCGENCCKGLSAPAPTLAKNLLGYDATAFVAHRILANERCPQRDQHEAAILELDTGPPCGGTFAESVLQRSLLAHAPPSLA